MCTLSTAARPAPVGLLWVDVGPDVYPMYCQAAHLTLVATPAAAFGGARLLPSGQQMRAGRWKAVRGVTAEGRGGRTPRPARSAQVCVCGGPSCPRLVGGKSPVPWGGPNGIV